MPITGFPIATKLATPADVGLASFTGLTTATLPLSTAMIAALALKRDAAVPINPGDIAQGGASSGQVLKWNGTAWAPGTDLVGSGGGGGGAVSSVFGRIGDVVPEAGDYSWAQLSGKPTTLSGAGITDAAPSSHVGAGGAAHADATTSTAGFMSASDKVKLTGISSGATVNSSDNTLLDRANHTGTQAISTITSLQAALDSKAPTANPTFTGTVAGITAAMVGLGSVNNTADASKPVSSAQAAAIALKNDNIQFQDEGSNLGSAGTVNTFNVVGAAASLARVGNVATLTISATPPAVELVPTGSAYTIVAADAGKVKYCSDTNPQQINLNTTFNGLSTSFVWPAAAGVITINVGAGVNVNGLGDGVDVVLSDRAGGIDIFPTGTNTFAVVGAVGDLVAADITNLGTGVATWMATPSSANLRAALTDETGTGVAVFNDSPVLISATASADPTAALGLATKQYVDGLAANLGRRQRVRAATTANVTISTALNNAETLDGVTLATGDLVLVKNQTAPAENGVYVVGVTPVRAAEFDTYDEHPGSLIAVQEGTAAADTLWLCTSNAGGTLNTTGIVFSQIAAGGLSDGDKGDITVSGSGTAFTIDAGVVTLAKMANLAQDQFIVRTTASTGVPETATCTAAARTVLDDNTVAAMVDTLGGASATGTGGLVRLSGPTFTGAPAAPTAEAGTNTTQLATTAYVVTERTTAATLAAKIIQLAALPGTDNTYEGQVITGRNAGTGGLTQWQSVYLESGGTWLPADANGTGTFPCRGIVVAAASAGNPAIVLDNGVARNDAWTWTIGGDIYLSTTAGGLTQTAPATAGDKVQKIGYALSADSMRVNIGSGEYLTVA